MQAAREMRICGLSDLPSGVKVRYRRDSHKTCLLLKYLLGNAFSAWVANSIKTMFLPLTKGEGREGTATFLWAATVKQNLRSLKEAEQDGRSLANAGSTALQKWPLFFSSEGNCWLRPWVPSWLPSFQSLRGLPWALSAPVLLLTQCGTDTLLRTEGEAKASLAPLPPGEVKRWHSLLSAPSGPVQVVSSFQKNYFWPSYWSLPPNSPSSSTNPPCWCYKHGKWNFFHLWLPFGHRFQS